MILSILDKKIDKLLHSMEDLKTRITNLENTIMTNLDVATIIANLKTEVEAEKDLMTAAATLITNLVGEIQKAATQGDLQKVQDLTTQAALQSKDLAALLTKYTASGVPTV